MSVDVNVEIFLIYGITIAVLIHSFKFRGAFNTLLFFFGGVIVCGGIENVNVTFGGYEYPTGGITFLIYECPIWVITGWYVIIYCAVFISHSLVGKGEGSLTIIGIGTEAKNGVDKQFIKLTIIRCAFAAYIAILLDLIMDPVGIANNWWVWKVDNIYIHGIPFGNYIGWLFVIFWTLFFFDIIVTKAHAEKEKEIITSAKYSIACIGAMFFAGLILMMFTFWFGMDGVRTDDRLVLMDLIINVQWELFIFVAIGIFIGIGLVLAASFAPNKLPEPRPNTKFWYNLPPILMLIFWAVMMVTAFFTSSLLVAVGIVDCIPLLILCVYVIKNPFIGDTE